MLDFTQRRNHMLQFITATDTAAGGLGLSPIIMLVLMIGVFYFLLIRPENKRKKEAEKMRSNVKVGDEITTIGGVNGIVVDVKEEKFVMETGADRVRIEFQKWALSTNETAAQAAAEEKRKQEEAKAKAKAAKAKEKAEKKQPKEDK